MGQSSYISRIYFKSSKRKVEYATIDYILESLYLMKAKDNLPVFKLLEILSGGYVDSVSFSRDAPHFYFYARAHKDYISIIIRMSDKDKEMEFQVPHSILKLAMKNFDEDSL